MTTAIELLYNPSVSKPSAKRNTIIVRVSDREKTMLAALAERTGMNYSELIRHLLREGFAKEEANKKESR